MFPAAFASLSASNPQAGQEYSRTHNGLSVETPHDARSLVVSLGLTATKCVPSRSHLYSSNERNVRHAADAVLRLFDGLSIISITFRSWNCLTALRQGRLPWPRFHNSTCLTLLYAHNYAYIMPNVKWGETIQDELSRGWSREIKHDLAGKVFPVFIDCVYQQGRYDEHGAARHGYAADAPFTDTPRDAREHYSKRFGIESSYRLAKQSLAFTSYQDADLRLVMFVVSLLLQNSYGISTGGTWRRPAAAGAASGDGSSGEFCEMVLRAAWTALSVHRAVPANQPLDNRFFR